MTLKKIADLPDQYPCRHPEHDIPQHIYLPRGVYEYECPACGTKRKIVSNPPSYSY